MAKSSPLGKDLPELLGEPEPLNRIRPREFAEGISSEWVLGNGRGGYASSTVIGTNTRAYHGLLVASLKPPVDRWLLLSSLDEVVLAGGEHHLATHQYPGTIYPQGYGYLQEFCQTPLPTFRFQAGDATVTKVVAMVPGENTVIVAYGVEGGCEFQVVPLTTCRSFHAVGPRPKVNSTTLEKGVRIDCQVPFTILGQGLKFCHEPQWYYNLEYEVERQRGLGWQEDCYSPGRFVAHVEDRAWLAMSATLESSAKLGDFGQEGLLHLLRREVLRQRELISRAPPTLSGPARGLVLAADSFPVERDGGKSIIAGYPWFDDWGRDAMIALPGLLLVPGRFGEAKKVLQTFARAMKGGILPNDLGARSYNTVDASLWFVHALQRYYRYTGDRNFVVDMWPYLAEMVEAYCSGTEVGFMDSDGLISSREGMTWMDARVGGVPVTPRRGKACEINALWYQALVVTGEMAEVAGITVREPWDGELASQVKGSFQRFWDPEGRRLWDVIDPLDRSMRPNQIVAAAFCFDLLSSPARHGVVQAVERELLTPYGLRTLSSGDDAYRGRYQGGPRERDSAYHQGTVWPWLMGPFVTAYVRAHRGSKASRKKAGEMLAPLLSQTRGGLNTVAEVYDGDPPQLPGGCISQAWSVGELLRCWHEDVMGRGTKISWIQ